MTGRCCPMKAVDFTPGTRFAAATKHTAWKSRSAPGNGEQSRGTSRHSVARRARLGGRATRPLSLRGGVRGPGPSHVAGGGAECSVSEDSVSEDTIREFEENGAVCLRGALSPAWVECLRAAGEVLERDSPGPCAEWIESGSGPGSETSVFFTDLEMACRPDADWPERPDTPRRINPFRWFARKGPCARLAGELMRAQSVCFLYDQWFQQQLLSGSETGVTPWHQDQPYWQVQGRQVVSVWAALDAAPRQLNVQFVRGSHRWGTEFAPFHFASGRPYRGVGPAPLLPQQDLRALLRYGGQEHELLSWDCEPGDVIVFSAMTVHGQSKESLQLQAQHLESDSAISQDEQFPRLFRRIATRWTGDDATYCTREGEAKDVIPSVHFPADGLSPGDKMQCNRFPLVWKRSDV